MDRQLNQLSYNELRVAEQRLLSDGYTWQWQVEPFILPGGGSHVVVLNTGTDPVLVSGFSLQVETTAITDVYFYYSPTGVGDGFEVTGFPLNHHKSRPSPMVSVLDSPIFFTPGTQIARDYIIGSGGVTSGSDMVLEPSAQYLMQILSVGTPAPAFSGPWVYSASNDAPAEGQAIYRGNADTLRVHHIDDDAASRQAELESVGTGWYITNDAGGSFTVTGVTPGASDVSYSVTGQGGTVGRSNWTFSGPDTVVPDALMSLSFSFAALPGVLPC